MGGNRTTAEASGISLPRYHTTSPPPPPPPPAVLLLLNIFFFSYLLFYSFNHFLKSFPRLPHYLNLFSPPLNFFFIFSSSYRSYQPRTIPSGTLGTCTGGAAMESALGHRLPRLSSSVVFF
jgi:hypothetical protein